MKKILNKLKRKKKQGGTPNTPPSSLRITNETVAEHRERILAGGRKFKYPLQYPKHRIVLITVVLVLLLILAVSGIGAWQLYGAQNTSKFIQRITQVVPLPVASVDGQTARYSDYLLELRSALHYLTTKEAVNFSSDDGRRQLDYQKRLALNKAIDIAYVEKLAKEANITVTDEELNTFVQNEIKSNRLGVTESVYEQVIKDYYDWTFDDYKDSVKKQLLHKKVVARIDTEGRQKVQAILQQARQGGDFAELAKQQTEDPLGKANGGDVGFISKSTDDPNGLIKVAERLEPGQVSEVIEGIDGFYLVKLIEKRENEIHFAKIYVTYKTFAKQLEALKKAGKIVEYISVPETVNSTSR